MKKSILIIFFAAFCSGCSSDFADILPSDQMSSVTYEVSNEVFANPERGFMHTWNVHSEGSPITVSSLEKLKSEKLSIVLRIYYLEKFKTIPLSQAQLDLIKTDFERLRNAGLKCVLRFAYTDAQNGSDAAMNMVDRQLDQLKPIVTENADVVAFVQAGFIGAWGEWFYTTNNNTSVASMNWVINKLLVTFPKEIKIQLRRPKIKIDIFGWAPMNANEGYSTNNIARLGYHNDCFLTGASDYGTYLNVGGEKAYMSQDAFFVPTGGETCPPEGSNALASCVKADNEMAYLKWTYLNLDWYGPALQLWRDNNCFIDFEKKLGDRPVLVSTNVKSNIALNSDFEFNAVINNVGYAPVYNKKTLI